MLIAAVGDTGYDILLFLHILFMFIALAPAFVHPFFDRQSRGYANRGDMWGAVVSRSQRIYGSALIVAGLLGFGVAGLSDEVYKMSQGWLAVSAALWIAMNGILHAVIVPAERAIAAGDESKTPRLEMGGIGITVLFLITLVLMVFKPGV